LEIFIAKGLAATINGTLRKKERSAREKKSPGGIAWNGLGQGLKRRKMWKARKGQKPMDCPVAITGTRMPSGKNNGGGSNAGGKSSDRRKGKIHHRENRPAKIRLETQQL